MESIQELRRKCQTSREWADTWHGRKIARRLSIYITSFFLRLGVSANFATGTFLAAGVCGGLLLLSGNRFMFVLGALFLQLSYILDHVDGEIARYRKQTSLTGIYFDHIAHYIIHPLFFFCFGLGLFSRTWCMSNLYLGLLAGLSISLMNIIPDIYNLTLGNKGEEGKGDPEQQNEAPSLSRKAFSYLHSVCTFPVIMDAFFIFAIFDLLFTKNTTVFLLWFYSLSMFFVWSAKLSYMVVTKKIDKASRGVSA